MGGYTLSSSTGSPLIPPSLPLPLPLLSLPPPSLPPSRYRRSERYRLRNEQNRMTGRDSQEMVEPRVFVNLAVPQWGEGHMLSCRMMSHMTSHHLCAVT